MRSFSKGIMLIHLLVTNTRSEESFFMTKEESKQILANVNKDKKTSQESKTRSYIVSGIFYTNPNNWVIWVNNIPYSSLGKHKDFIINNVSENSVVITLSNGNILKMKVEI